jgi:hypothetical protein
MLVVVEVGADFVAVVFESDSRVVCLSVERHVYVGHLDVDIRHKRRSESKNRKIDHNCFLRAPAQGVRCITRIQREYTEI